MPFFVYVIQGTNNDYLYRGHCRDLKKILRQYNSAVSPKLKKHAPFRIIYSERFDGRIAAVQRERFFKTPEGRRFLKEVLGL